MSRSGAIERMSATVHDLCQPLTTLQCRLELASLVGTEDACREAVQEALEDCRRMMRVVETLREILRTEKRQATAGQAGSGQ